MYKLPFHLKLKDRKHCVDDVYMILNPSKDVSFGYKGSYQMREKMHIVYN